MSELKQEQLMTYIDAAFTFYECVKGKGYLPNVKQTQKLLEAGGIHESLERIKGCGDIVRELQVEEEEEQVKRVHENLKQLTFTKTGNTHHPLYVRLQTPDRVDIGLWLDRWQTVDVVSWLQSLVSRDSLVDRP